MKTRGARICVLVGLIGLGGCGDDGHGGPDAAVPNVSVRGQIVSAPGTPLPIQGVTVSVIDPAPENPDFPIQTKTDRSGQFALGKVQPTSSGRVRLFIDGTTGGGGPYITMNTEFPVDPKTGLDTGTIHLVRMDPAGTIPITPENATITRGPDGRKQATLKLDLALAGGYVPGESPTDEPRSAQLRLPAGSMLTFPFASPLLVNVTRVDVAALPAPMPMNRFTNYFVTLQPAGLGLGAPVGLQLPELDAWPVGMPVELWEADTSTQMFQRKQMGTVRQIPGFGPFAVADAPFIARFCWYAATPPCQTHSTQVSGRVVDSSGSPVAGATVRTLGLHASTSPGDGRFSFPNLPLGCDPFLAQLEVLASFQRNDGTYLAGTSGPQSPVPDGTTDVGDILLATPLYVVRATPDAASAVPIDTAFDLFFSEPLSPATIAGVHVALRRSSLQGGSCVSTDAPVPGTAILDAADATHVRFVPQRELSQGTAYVGQALATVVRAVSGHVLPADFETRFVTRGGEPPAVQITYPGAAGATFGSGLTITAAGGAVGGGGVVSARWQLFQTDASGTMMGPQVGGDIPAGLTVVDPCAGNQNVRLSGAIPLPAVSAVGYFKLHLLARDSAGNEGATEAFIRVVPPGQTFPFCGTAQAVAYISSNGFITFDTTDNDYTPTVQKFFQRPRVSAMYTDVDVRRSTSIPDGDVFWNVLAGSDPAFVVTWYHVGMFSNQPGPDSFQIVLYQSGAMQISFGAMGDAVPTTTRDFFVGVSCPGTPQSPAPVPTPLLTPQPQPDTTNQGTDINPWNGEPVYDFFTAPATPPPSLSQVFATRYFNFVLPGQQPKPFVPLFTSGVSVPNILCDDCATAVPIAFGAVPCQAATVSTLAGNGAATYMDGTGGPTGTASFYRPAQVAVDSGGVVYVADSLNQAIRKVMPTGATSTLARMGPTGGLLFVNPQGVAVDVGGNVYVADAGAHRIYKVTPAGQTLPFAGSGAAGFADGAAMQAQFNFPAGLAVDGAGNVYVADQNNNRIRKITPAGATQTLAGNGAPTLADGTGGPTGTASFFRPIGIAVDANGVVYVADASNNAIRKIQPNGMTTTLSGGPGAGFMDGPPGSALFNNPNGVAVGAGGFLYVADSSNERIRKLASDGTTSTLAGTGTLGFGDGGGCNAQFANPFGVAFGGGALYVGDYDNHRIRKIAGP